MEEKTIFIVTHDAATGQTVSREMTEDEKAAHQALQGEASAEPPLGEADE